MVLSLYKCECGKITEHHHPINKRPETIKCECGQNAGYSFKDTIKNSRHEVYWFNDPHYGAISRRFL